MQLLFFFSFFSLHWPIEWHFLCCRYSQCTNPLELMERCLKWRHLAPTAPDTLTCVPFATEDPFVIGSGEESAIPPHLLCGVSTRVRHQKSRR